MDPKHCGIGLCHPVSFHSPFPSLYPILFRDPSHKLLLLQQVQALCALGAIKEVPFQQLGKRFYSWYFPIPKSKGGIRPILNLCNLNKYIKHMRFHMITIATILPALNHSDWFATLDL